MYMYVRRYMYAQTNMYVCISSDCQFIAHCILISLFLLISTKCLLLMPQVSFAELQQKWHLRQLVNQIEILTYVHMYCQWVFATMVQSISQSISKNEWSTCVGCRQTIHMQQNMAVPKIGKYRLDYIGLRSMGDCL